MDYVADSAYAGMRSASIAFFFAVGSRYESNPIAGSPFY